MNESTHLSLPCFGGGHDRAAVLRSARSEEPEHRLLVVADGAGGARAASQAAELVVAELGRRFDRRERAIGPVGLRRELERLDGLLRDEPTAGQSTAVVVEVVGTSFWGASVGDSGAWLVEGGRHLDLTRGQDRKWRLGTGFAQPRSFGPLPLVGTLLLGTDGLFECAAPDRLHGALGDVDIERIATRLGQAVATPDGGLRDDLALVLLRAALPDAVRSCAA